MTRLVAKLERRIKLEKALDRAEGELARARARLAPLAMERGEAREAAVRFKAALGTVYDDRATARRSIRDFAQREGASAAARQIAAHPERFGELRGTELGMVRSAEREQAVQEVEKLSRASDEYLRKTDVAREHVREYRDATRAVVRAETKRRTLDAELGRSPGVAQLRLQIREKIRGLQPQRRQDVSLRLSPSQRLLLGTSMTVGLAFAREQGHER